MATKTEYVCTDCGKVSKGEICSICGTHDDSIEGTCNICELSGSHSNREYLYFHKLAIYFRLKLNEKKTNEEKVKILEEFNDIISMLPRDE